LEHEAVAIRPEAAGRIVYEALVGVRVPKDDRFQVITDMTLIEVKKENWSFGNGIAQYAV